MTLISVPIDSITEDHLRSLVEDQVMELRVIEYKSELPGRSNGDKKEFLADVCSFANTAGGDLIYGITESGGTPRDLMGTDTGDIDAEISRLDSSIREGIRPRIPGIQHQPVRLENDKHALVVRVPRSFSRPHVVTYKNHWKFYARISNGKYQMDVGEVRQAFVLSESVADRIRAFRAERLSRVVSRETPAPLDGTSRVVLHVVPISAFDSPASVVGLDVRRPPLNERSLLPISVISRVTEEELDEFLRSNPSDFFPRYNFDGVFCDPQLVAPGAGYVQLFRTGVIEAADNDAFVEEEEMSARNGYIDGYLLDEGLIKAVHRYFRLLGKLGVKPPIFLLLSLVGVRGYQMLHRQMPYGHRSALRPVDRDDLVVQEVLVESLEYDLHDLPRLMRPLFDAVWNAVGLPRSLHYDDSGNWQSRS
jgi:hypothetical protein